MSVKPLSGARITARVLFVVAVLFLAVTVGLFVSPVHAIVPSSDGDRSVACGALAASNVFQLRNEANREAQQNADDNLQRALDVQMGSSADSVPDHTGDTPYAQADACEQAIQDREPWAWMAFGLMVLSLLVAITIRVAARAPRSIA